MAELIKERVNENLRRLNLNRITEVFDQVIQQAEDNHASYLDVVDQLLAEEVGVKEDRRFKTALKTAGLPFEKTIEEYDFSFHPDLDKRSVMNLFDLSLFRKKKTPSFLVLRASGKVIWRWRSPSRPPSSAKASILRRWLI